ncbi:MAG TPA: FkbM family methyltransferase [Pseudolabrys sp.]|nr:FkbM family methyltransferase [Pseudolabrys sp.]
MIPAIDDVNLLAARVRKSIPDGLARGEVSTGLYGLGFLGRWAVPRLIARGVKLVACYDANESIAGTTYHGLPVHHSGVLESSRPEFIVITARHAVEPVSSMLSGLTIPHVSYDAWHVAENFPEFRHVHDDVLFDERSRQVLRAVLMTMLTGKTNYCAAACEENQYFCLPRFFESGSEHFVDAGAYDGDSVEKFISTRHGAFAKIYAFEPGPRQFSTLKTRIERLLVEQAFDANTIEAVNAGLGDGEYLASAGTTSGQMTNLAVGYDSAGAGVALRIVSLDGFMKERPVTFLKADVEGMELALLKGARSTIRRNKPKIAICVYHYPTDIPEIAGYLAGLVPDYRFALRHHSRQFMETVLYCWVD